MDAVRPRNGLQFGESFETGIARPLVADDRAALGGPFTASFDHGNLDRYDLRFETSFRDRTRGPELRFKTEMVGVLTGDAVFGRDPLGALELAGKFIALAVLAADWLAQPRLGAGQRVGANGQQTHVLDAAGEHHIFGSGSDQAGGDVDRELARAALRVD